MVVSLAFAGTEKSKVTIETPIKDAKQCEISSKMVAKEFASLHPYITCELKQ
jgi:hypothetical protein